MDLNIWQNIVNGFEFLMELPEYIVEPIGFLPEFAKEALAESLSLIPFLFVVFLFIEIIEQYFAKKRHLLVFFVKKIGPIFGSLFASIPQCGFSVIATTLYTRRILSRGTLLSVYFATSDEAIPVLVADPSMVGFVLPIVVLKVILAIIVGYLVDVFVSYKAKDPVEVEASVCTNPNCNHHHKFTDDVKTKSFWFYPIKHTFNIFIFILIVSLLLSFVLAKVGSEDVLAKYCLLNSPLQPIVASLIGLIPNCAISVMLTLLFMKHTISFGSLIAGLSSAGGLGMLVLFKRNCDKKDTAIIIALLIIISSFVGLVLQYNLFNINRVFDIFGIQI